MSTDGARRMTFHCAVLGSQQSYSGRELRSGWAADKTGLSGDIGVGFIGPCHVATEDLVDMDDARAGEHIAAASMAHVIIEHSGCSIETAVLRQRLLVALLGELLQRQGIRAIRDGDDLYVDHRKLTVSIAAPAADAALIHLGINIDPSGAPVAAAGLGEWSVDPVVLLQDLLERYHRELKSCAHAQDKVRSVP